MGFIRLQWKDREIGLYRSEDLGIRKDNSGAGVPNFDEESQIVTIRPVIVYRTCWRAE